MGCSNSKTEKNNALRLCKERRRFIKQAIESRCALAAAHLSYIQSLRNLGISLRRFAEAEALIESPLSTSTTEIDKTPSHSTYPSPSPSHIAEVNDSPFNNESPLQTASPHSPPVARLSYMRSGGSTALTVRLNPSSSNYVDDETLPFSMPPPPPPPPPEGGSSWDFFDPADESESFRFMAHNNLGELEQKTSESAFFDASERSDGAAQRKADDQVKLEDHGHISKDMGRALMGKADLEQSGSKREKNDLCAEREDASEFITHRAKDFLSSIKDIEHRFFRASESGKEVSKMLEANKIKFRYSEAKGGTSLASALLAALKLVCCLRKNAPVSHEPSQNLKKVITWNRSTSSHSSSSKNPLATASKDDVDDSGSEFVEEFCMIAGSHSSTLDRLYAWERKLYDEVKASESIRKVYDRKCNKLRHQFAKDQSAQVIDKTRAVVKDLHSRIRVAIYAVDSISRRIEKLRDEELLPQLVELTQGLIKMWKAMLECHHSQYITISLAYHTRSSTEASHGDTHRQIMVQLHHEIECFSLSFTNLIRSHTSYIEHLNSWLQNCILLPIEPKNRRPFSPRRVVAPPIFVLCRDWLAGIKSLPTNEVSDAIRSFLSDLHHSMGQAEELQKQQKPVESNSNGGESESKQGDRQDEDSSNLRCIHNSLTKMLDRLTKFSEASLKMHEDVRQKTEGARIKYLNCTTSRF